MSSPKTLGEHHFLSLNTRGVKEEVGVVSTLQNNFFLLIWAIKLNRYRRPQVERPQVINVRLSPYLYHI